MGSKLHGVDGDFPVLPQYFPSTSVVLPQCFRRRLSGLRPTSRLTEASPYLRCCQPKSPCTSSAKGLGAFGGRDTLIRRRSTVGFALVAGCGVRSNALHLRTLLSPGGARIKCRLPQDETIMWGFVRCQPWSKPIEASSQSRLFQPIAPSYN